MALNINRRDQFTKKPAAIIFDTDNTLYPYDYPHKMATKAVEDKAVKLLDVDRKTFSECFATARQSVKKQLKSTASSHSRLLYFQKTVEALGLKTQVLLTLDLEQTYWRTFLSHTKLFPGIRELILSVRRNDINTAVVTDLTAQIQFRKLSYFGLDDGFDFVVTSEEAGEDKPGRDPFELALLKLGVAPSACWMIGDDASTDIAGASALGITSIQKRHDGVAVYDGKAGPDMIIDSFEDLHTELVSWGWLDQ
jgi:HAD superfamily hydrolase (TIGR01549 family)